MIPRDASPSASPSPALQDAFWRVVAREGWHGVTFARVAEESGESLSDLRGRYPTPVDLLRAHARAVDQAVLEGTVPGQAGFGSARDRVFDLLMRRLDVLAPHRDGVLRMQRDLMRDPLSALLLSPILMASMAWTLEGAGVSTAGFRGALRVQGLAGVWVSVARAWADDESADLGTTMAALDRALDRAERVARTLRLTDEEAMGAGPMGDPMGDPLADPLGDPSGDPLGASVRGADSVPPDVVEPPLAETGIMLAEGSAEPPLGIGPLPPAEPSSRELHDPASPDAPPRPTPPRKTGGPGDLPIA